MRIESERLVSLNPATLEPVGSVALTDPADLPGRVRQARSAFPAWREAGLDARIRIIRRAEELLCAQAEEIARLITLEMGRPFAEAFTTEVEASIDLLYYYWKHAHKFLRDRRVPLHSVFFKTRKSFIHFQALGVVANITPWNWPLLIPLGVIVPALLAGNAVLFKPSEYTPLVGEKIREVFIRAGVPEDILINVHGGAEAGRAASASGVEKVFFTGSTAVGQAVMAQAAALLTKVVLELGGNDPAVVLDDADVEIASSGILWGGFNNCGQNCNAVERVFVHRRIYDRFVSRLVEKSGCLRIGDGMDSGTDIGPLATGAQRDKINRIVRAARNSGMDILAGGNTLPDKKGNFFTPTLITCEGNGDVIPDEEVFGPILYLKPVRDDDEAVRLANASQFGLAASVWTSNLRRGERIARQLESGTVMINDAVVSFGMTEAGWTGIKKSGVGWMHGEKGLDEMVNMQYINADPLFHTQKMWWFPYSEKMVAAIRAGLVFLFSRNILKQAAAVPAVLKHFTGYLVLNRPKRDKL
ncbi:MAG TPA: aldehyde dehydrogenase family protein [bacterium]|nr:aldehyde dehydrogenase family protein [bacterium]